MKLRTGLLIFIFGTLCALTAGATELRLERAEGQALIVRLSSVTDLLTGVQFDLEYDADALDIEVASGPVAETSGKSVRTATRAQSGKRVLVVGFNRNQMTEGVVATLQVSLKPGAPPQRSFRIRLTSMAGTNGNGQAVEIGGKESVVALAFDQRESK